MAVFISFLAVLALGGIAYYGALAGFQYTFGVIVPYAAVVVFVAGFIYALLKWARSPVPFRIPTTGGQQKSLDFITPNRLDNPTTKAGTVGRMILEVLAFRSLFRNTAVEIKQTETGPRVVYHSSKWLWLFAILFHYSFLVVFIRHFRFFLDPVPFAINGLEFVDALMQVGAPRLFMSGAVLALAVTLLLFRRLLLPKMKYISLTQDYFHLFLILGIALTGIWMRYVGKTDIASVKVLTMGLVNLNPTLPEGIAPIFYAHLFLVSLLLIVFPFSKLMHMGGVFMSPTRNLPNDSRIRHHENPWNPPKKYHTYEAYEDEFRENMVEVGLPVEKMPEETPEEEPAEKE